MRFRDAGGLILTAGPSFHPLIENEPCFHRGLAFMLDAWDAWQARLDDDERMLIQCARWSKGGATMDQIERWPRSKLIRRLKILSEMNQEEYRASGGLNAMVDE